MTYGWTASTTTDRRPDRDGPRRRPEPEDRHVHRHPGRPDRQGHAADRGQRRRRSVLRPDDQDAWFRPNTTGSFTLNATVTDQVSLGGATVTFPDVSAWPAGRARPVATTRRPPSRRRSPTAGRAGRVRPVPRPSPPHRRRHRHRLDHDQRRLDAADRSGGNAGRRPLVRQRRVAHRRRRNSTPARAWTRAARVVERAAATLTNGACGTYGAFAPVTLSGTTDSSVSSGSCYRYQAKATDNVGNVSAVSQPSADAKVDGQRADHAVAALHRLLQRGRVGQHRLLPAGRERRVHRHRRLLRSPVRRRLLLLPERPGLHGCGIGPAPHVRLDQHRDDRRRPAHDHRDERRWAELGRRVVLTGPRRDRADADGPLQRRGLLESSACPPSIEDAHVEIRPPLGRLPIHFRKPVTSPTGSLHHAIQCRGLVQSFGLRQPSPVSTRW